MSEEYDKLNKESGEIARLLIIENEKYNDMLKLPYAEVKDDVGKSMKDIKSLEKKLRSINRKMDTIRNKEIKRLQYITCMDILKGMGFESIKLYPDWEEDDRICGLKLKTKTGEMTIKAVCTGDGYDCCGSPAIEITFEPTEE